MSKSRLENRMAACPLCERDNCCGLVTSGATGCWCFGEKVPASLLQQVAPEDRARRCVCQACIRNHRSDSLPLPHRIWRLLQQIRKSR
jgi:hypothetical protein